MGMIKLLAAPVRHIVRFPLFQLAFVVAVILFLQAGDDKSARGQIFNAVDVRIIPILAVAIMIGPSLANGSLACMKESEARAPRRILFGSAPTIAGRSG